LENKAWDFWPYASGFCCFQLGYSAFKNVERCRVAHAITFFFLKRPSWKLIVIYLFDKFPAFMKSKIPLLYSQERGIGPGSPPAESSLQRI
jgi:hypothetical protein